MRSGSMRGQSWTRSFFIESFEYAVSHMPVNDELLVNAELVYFEEKGKA